MPAVRFLASCALALLVAGCGGENGGAAHDRGAVVYATHCATCHAGNGTGVGRNPPLTNSATVQGDPDVLIAWVMSGKRPATLPPLRGLVVMPQFTWLSDDDLAAVLSHVRTGFGNGQPPVSTADVAAVRAAAAP